MVVRLMEIKNSDNKKLLSEFENIMKIYLISEYLHSFKLYFKYKQLLDLNINNNITINERFWQYFYIMCC